MNVLFLGEIVGKPGIATIKSLKAFRESEKIDLVIANAEGATGGFGIGKAHAMQLSKLGIDILTGGEKIYYKLDMVDFISKTSWILRPANYPLGNPGHGTKNVEIDGRNVVVINLLGTSSFQRVHLNNPYILAQSLIGKIKEEHPSSIILVVFHAATTAEKQTMGFFLDGKVSAVIGTHTKVMSADETILPGGTAYITDNGRCGSQLGVGGFDSTIELRKFTTGIPERSHECWDRLELQGVMASIGKDGKATAIKTVRIPVTDNGKEV